MSKGWNRNGSIVLVFTAVYFRADMLLLVGVGNLYPPLVAVFPGCFLLERKLSFHLEAELRKRWQQLDNTEYQETMGLELDQWLERATG